MESHATWLKYIRRILQYLVCVKSRCIEVKSSVQRYSKNVPDKSTYYERVLCARARVCVLYVETI